MRLRGDERESRLTDRLLVRLLLGIYVVINGAVGAFRFFLWPRSRPANARSVCIFRVGNVGDTICALAAINAIRREYAGASLTLLTSPGSRGLPGAKDVFAAIPWIDGIIEYVPEEVSGFRQSMNFVRLIRSHRFDVFIELSNDLVRVRHTVRNMIFARLAGVKWGGGWSINTLRFAVRAQSALIEFPNEVERLIKDVERIGITVDRPECSFPITIEQDLQAAEIVRTAGAPLGARFVAVAPGAKRPANRWPVERFTEVVRELTCQGYYVLIFGSESEREAGEKIRLSVGSNCSNLAGLTDIPSAAAILKHCCLLICNDSGLQHAASAVGTPCVAVFSARDLWGKWRPQNARSLMLRRMVPCHTCYVQECPHNNLCLTEISSGEVTDAALKILTC